MLGIGSESMKIGSLYLLFYDQDIARFSTPYPLSGPPNEKILPPSSAMAS
jgi:hypothetical protein